MEKKIKALFVPTTNSGIAFYRMYNFWGAAARTGAMDVYMPFWRKDIFESNPWETWLDKHADHGRYFSVMHELNDAMRQCDVVVMQMVHYQASLDLFMSMREAYPHIPVLAECDDNYLSTATYNPASQAYDAAGTDFRRVATSQFKMADAVMVSTPYLKDVYGELNDHVYVMPNCIDTIFWNKLQPRRRPGVRIGWAGGASHVEDLRLIVPVMHRLLEKHKDLRFVFVHGIPEFLKGIPRVECVQKFERIDRYPRHLAHQDFDIGIAPLLDNAFNRSKCVTGDTLIVTNDGVKRIEDVSTHRVADEFQAMKGQPFSHFYYGGIQKIARIKTRMGFEIAGTETHRIQNDSGKWVSLSDTKIGDSIKLNGFEYPKVKYQEVKFPLWLTYRVDYKAANYDGSMMPSIKINEDWGRFLGYIIGDGHLSRTNSLGISCSTDYPDIIDDVKRLYRMMSLHPQHIQKVVKHGNVLVKTKGVDVKATSNHLLAFLRHINIESRAYLNTKNLRIPDIIWRSPKSVIREFISALFETDGTVSSECSRISFTTKSYRLAQDVQFALLGFGIAGSISAKWNKAYARNYYSVILGREFSDEFHKQIGFISKKKCSALEAIVNKSHSNRFKSFEWHDEIVSKTSEAMDHVYDVTIPVTHLYNANGFVSHNSNLRWLEYSALGVPTVAYIKTDNPGHTHFEQTIRHGTDGFIARNDDEFENYLNHLICNRTERTAMGMRAKERIATDFNVDKMVYRYADILREVMARGQVEKQEDRLLHGNKLFSNIPRLKPGGVLDES